MTFKANAVAATKILLGKTAAESMRDKLSNAEYIEVLKAMRDTIEVAITRCKES